MNISKIGVSLSRDNISNKVRKGIIAAKTAIVGVTMAAVPDTTAIATPTRLSVDFFKKPQFEYYYGNHPSYYIYEMAKNVVSLDINSGKFVRSLSKNKEKLMTDLNLSEEQMDLYKKVIKHISKDENNIFGIEDPGCPEIENPFLKKPSSDDTSLPSLFSFLKREEYEPIDVEKFDVLKPTQNEIDICKRFGVDLEKMDLTSEEKAISTIVRLSELEKGYIPYVQKMYNQRPNAENPSVSASIRNAKNILSNQMLGKLGIAELEASSMGFSVLDGLNAQQSTRNVLSTRDIDDLRIFARSVIFPKEVYLVESWDRKAIIPVGKNKDKACANILSALIKYAE